MSKYDLSSSYVLINIALFVCLLFLFTVCVCFYVYRDFTYIHTYIHTYVTIINVPNLAYVRTYMHMCIRLDIIPKGPKVFGVLCFRLWELAKKIGLSKSVFIISWKLVI